jgi:hypothetical protein
VLFGEEGTSLVAELKVELVFDHGRGFRPDPYHLGLTALGAGNDSFHEAMQRAWRCSGLSQCACRGRWWIAGYRSPDTGAARPLHVPNLAGRSCEAAACCALWAALGRIPGEAGHPGDEPLELDPLAAISAQLKEPSGQGRAIQLGTVGGVPEKLKAAREAGLEMILLADGQDPRDYADHSKERPGDPRLVRRLVRTMGEAFEQLLVYRRTLGNYHDHVSAEWRNRWSEISDDVVSP